MYFRRERHVGTLAADFFYKVKEGKGITSAEPPRSYEVNHR